MGTTVRVLVAGLLALLLNGCEGVVNVNGTVVSQSNEPVDGCRLEIYDRADGDRDDLKRTDRIASIFHASFAVSPTPSYYYFVVTCDSYDRPYRSEAFLIGGSSYGIEPLDLGTIVMHDS